MQLLADPKEKIGQMNTSGNAAENPSLSLHCPGVSSVLTRVSDFLTLKGIRAYVVGGFIRDALLKRDTVDIDIAVSTDALTVAPQLAESLGGSYVLLDELNGVGRVVLQDEGSAKTWTLDLTSFEGSLETDLARRDFTINTLAVALGQLAQDAATIQIIDPFNGLKDLEEGVIRVVTPGVFEADAARLLRGVRLAHELGFRVAPETLDLIQDQAHLVAGVAGERVREELLRLLALPRTEKMLSWLDKLGLLTALIPELLPEKGVTQPPEHHWNVFNHSLKTVAAAGFLLGEGSWEYVAPDVITFVPWSARLGRHFDSKVSGSSTRRICFKLAALLHDIAKPQTKSIEENGRMRFLGHAQDGAVVVEDILKRLRFSVKETNLITNLVKYHLRPTQMSQQGLPSARAIYRYFRDTGEVGVDILFLSLADHLATRGPGLIPTEWQQHTRLVAYVLQKRFEEQAVVKPPKIISGNDLIKTFGLAPGPRIGELLEAVREAQAAGELSTKEEALAYVGRKLQGSTGKHAQK